MRFVASPAIVAAFRAAYDLPEGRPAPDDVGQACARTAASGWIGLPEMGNALLGSDARLSRIPPREMLDAFGLRSQPVYAPPFPERPKDLDPSKAVESVAAADFAGLLILLERAGFAVDPEPLCLALRPAIEERRLVSRPEKAILEHGQQRHGMEPVTLAAGEGASSGEPADTLRTSTGYQVRCWRDEAGNPTALAIASPRHGRPLSSEG